MNAFAEEFFAAASLTFDENRGILRSEDGCSTLQLADCVAAANDPREWARL